MTANSTNVGQIKGSVLISRLNMVRTFGGPQRVDEVLSRLPASDQAVLRGMILPITWYPLDLNLRLDKAIVEVLSPDTRREAFLEMGRASATENLKGAHHVFVRAGEPHYLLSQAPQIYRFYYSKGHRTYEKVGPTSAVIRTFDAEDVSEEDCLTVVGWHQRAVELSGVKSCEVTEPKCRAHGDAHCEYRVSWTF